MTVLLRTKQRTDGGSRLRPRIRHQPQTQSLPAGSSTAEPALRPLGTDRRTLPDEDRATYNCGCGYIFSHDVSTSVACPHCGDAQAW
jgi:hypothetical protein